MKSLHYFSILIFLLVFGSLFVGASVVKREVLNERSFPSNLDWRDMHGRSWVPEHDISQNGIGTCWAFASVAALESQYMLTRLNTPSINLAELYLIEYCAECWADGAGCPVHGGNMEEAAWFMASEYIARESSDCYPYSDLVGNENDCWFEGGEYNCGTAVPPIDGPVVFSLSGLSDPQKLDKIKEVLWIYGPVAAVFQGGSYSEHGMLIYGYDSSTSQLLVRDSADDQSDFHTTSQMPSDLLALLYYDAVGCQNDDMDDYCWWGIAAFHSGIPKPDSCDDLGCDRDIPDCDDDDYNEHGCEFMCGNGICEPWEACYVGQPNGGCFQDCYRSNGRSYACCGDGIFDEGEDCTWCPQDVPGGCPECSDRIDNDGDGFVDYEGYLFFGADSGCNSFFDNKEKSKPKIKEYFMSHHMNDDLLI